jgi:hypothetical protein
MLLFAGIPALEDADYHIIGNAALKGTLVVAAKHIAVLADIHYAMENIGSGGALEEGYVVFFERKSRSYYAYAVAV